MTAARKYYAISGMTVATSDAEGLTCDSCRRYLRWPREAASRRTYLLTDHLGSVAAITDDEGSLLDQQRYLPFGAERPNVGTITQTDFGYTGQSLRLWAQGRAMAAGCRLARRDLAGMGLMDYKARMYDSTIGRFIQPDSIVPQPEQPQDLNRYAYVVNRPIVLNDPTGHCPMCVPVVILVGLGIAMSQVPSDQVQDDTSRQGDPAVMLAGLMIAAGAPEIVGLGGAGLMALGNATKSTRLWAIGYDAQSEASAWLAGYGMRGPRSGDSACRYMSEGEAAAVRRNGDIIPNVDARGRPRLISTSPDKYGATEEAEQGLLMGKQNPAGVGSSPAYRATYQRDSVSYLYAGNSQTGGGTEMLTSNSIRIRLLDRIR
jgi:RHS repeat-associated protein